MVLVTVDALSVSTEVLSAECAGRTRPERHNMLAKLARRPLRAPTAWECFLDRLETALLDAERRDQ